KRFAKKLASKFQAAKEKVRRYRLFAKTKDKKNKLVAQMATLCQSVQRQLGKALQAARAGRGRLSKYGKVAHERICKLSETMKTLVPQIRYWLRTGYVAAGKIINVHMPELYSIVRGKIGKTVEFGLNWGIARLRGGYLLATL